MHHMYWPRTGRTNEWPHVFVCSSSFIPPLRLSSKRPAITSWRRERASWVLSREAGRRPLWEKPTLCTVEMRPEASAGCWGRPCYRSRDLASMGLETTLVCTNVTCGQFTLITVCACACWLVMIDLCEDCHQARFALVSRCSLMN